MTTLAMPHAVLTGKRLDVPLSKLIASRHNPRKVPELRVGVTFDPAKPGGGSIAWREPTSQSGPGRSQSFHSPAVVTPM